MYQQQIFDEALSRVKARRLEAQRTQEQHIAQIRAEIPETVELDAQLRQTCFSMLQASGSGSPAERAKRMSDIAKHSQAADRMLRELLVAHGYPADYQDIHYSCPACNDTGFTGSQPCECLKREIGLVGAEQMNRQSQLALCSFETFCVDYYRALPMEQFKTMEENYQQCVLYADQFRPETAQNILMTGPTGVGKTHLSLSIANELLKKGWSVIYDSAGSLFHKLDQEKFGREQGDTLSLLLDCDLLILDDFGTEFSTSFTQAMVYTIFNGRINANKPMIINTNFSMQELQEVYGNRIMSRLFSVKLLKFFGKDIRYLKSLQKK